ncbi:hypothetical protein SAY86_006691 [Trapa natans]|uniref:Uncharacterized protein n=1 Tax=Trapa natans TaxID=22666 RepID=A0AAN7QXV3_TRANT|nr:hypothetical protein SAY86_006691 [Trapa natans]
MTDKPNAMPSSLHPPGATLPAPTTIAPASSTSFADPAVSTSTTNAAHTVRSLPNFLANPSSHQLQQQILDTVPIRPRASPQGIVYPVASSGLAFIPHKPHIPAEGTVTIASPDPRNRPIMAFTPSQHLVQPSHGSTVALPAPVPPKMVAHSPARSSKSAANGLKDPRDRGKEDCFIVVRDRRVRLSGVDSLYSLGRSWLRNGYPDERMVWQSPCDDFAKVLPRPLPMSMAESLSLAEGDKEENKMENVDGLSAKDLLKGHIEHAKRVRLRAKEERKRRISRVTNRIRLLLPPLEVEQLRSDSASGS